jgi:hypothetical protein
MGQTALARLVSQRARVAQKTPKKRPKTLKKQFFWPKTGQK